LNIEDLKFNISGNRFAQSVLINKIGGLAKSPRIVMPVPDRVRDDGSGIQNMLDLLDSVKASLCAWLTRLFHNSNTAIIPPVMPDLIRHPGD
jgi:hypothetical protein